MANFQVVRPNVMSAPSPQQRRQLRIPDFSGLISSLAKRKEEEERVRAGKVAASELESQIQSLTGTVSPLLSERDFEPSFDGQPTEQAQPVAQVGQPQITPGRPEEGLVLPTQAPAPPTPEAPQVPQQRVAQQPLGLQDLSTALLNIEQMKAGGLLDTQTAKPLIDRFVAIGAEREASFGQPLKVALEGGEPAFVVTDKAGNVKVLEEIKPLLEKKAKTPTEVFDQSNVLRDDFTKASGEFVKINSSFNRIQAAGIEPTAAGDLALIFNYMKMLDPGSVVRESEFATAETAAGVPDRIRKTYNKIVRGEKLAPEQRKDFLDRAGKLFASSLKAQRRLESQFTDMSKRFDLNPSNIVIDFSGIEQTKNIKTADDLLKDLGL